MQYLKFIVLGIVFGAVMVKAEIISWFRIFEMFNFQSFHMFGIIGSAVLIGAVGTYILKKTNAKTIAGDEIIFSSKNMSVTRYLVGGIFFGLGWALVGACPGPMFVLLGAGYLPIFIVIVGAVIGTFLYGILRNRLPH